MNKEEIKKQYANGIVNADEVIKSLIDKFKTDKTSVDIQQLQLVAEYLIYKVDKLQKENEELKEDNKFLNFLAHWNNQGRYYPYLETSYTDTSYFIKKAEIIKIVNSFVEEMNELLGDSNE